MVRDLKDPTTLSNTPRPTVLSTDYNKDTIMVMIKTEDIKKDV